MLVSRCASAEVADQFAATAGEDWWAVGEALLLAAAGGGSSDAAAVLEYDAADRSVAGASRVGAWPLAEEKPGKEKEAGRASFHQGIGCRREVNHGDHNCSVRGSRR